MTFRISLFLVAALLIAGCTPQDTPTDTPDNGDEGEAVTVSYTCASGAVADATYWNDAATVVYDGVTHDVSATEAASGVRYVGGTFVWWTDGSEATVYALDEEGNTGEALDTCTQTVIDWIEDSVEDLEDAAGEAAGDVEEAVENAIDELEEAVEEAREGE